jgi:hypothetical protein
MTTYSVRELSVPEVSLTGSKISKKSVETISRILAANLPQLPAHTPADNNGHCPTYAWFGLDGVFCATKRTDVPSWNVSPVSKNYGNTVVWEYNLKNQGITGPEEMWEKMRELPTISYADFCLDVSGHLDIEKAAELFPGAKMTADKGMVTFFSNSVVKFYAYLKFRSVVCGNATEHAVFQNHFRVLHTGEDRVQTMLLTPEYQEQGITRFELRVRAGFLQEWLTNGMKAADDETYEPKPAEKDIEFSLEVVQAAYRQLLKTYQWAGETYLFGKKSLAQQYEETFSQLQVTQALICRVENSEKLAVFVGYWNPAWKIDPPKNLVGGAYALVDNHEEAMTFAVCKQLANLPLVIHEAGQEPKVVSPNAHKPLLASTFSTSKHTQSRASWVGKEFPLATEFLFSLSGDLLPKKTPKREMSNGCRHTFSEATAHEATPLTLELPEKPKVAEGWAKLPKVAVLLGVDLQKGWACCNGRWFNSAPAEILEASEGYAVPLIEGQVVSKEQFGALTGKKAVEAYAKYGVYMQ